MVWLTGGALALSLAMISGLLALIVVQGTATFWPRELVEQTLDGGDVILGEESRAEEFQPEPGWLEQLPPAAAARAQAQLERAQPLVRRLWRVGNFELTGQHFRWVADVEVESSERPAWACLVERVSWGRFYGVPTALVRSGEVVASEPGAILRDFAAAHRQVVDRLSRQRRLEKVDMGRLNRRLEDARLAVREEELAGSGAERIAAAQSEFEQAEAAAGEEFRRLREEIDSLEAQNQPWALRLRTSAGKEVDLPLATIVRVVPANRLSRIGALGVYLVRWGEFLTADPREANSEGGVFPAIFGTVVMTLIMSLAVVPLGVLAALYLREYAKAGWAVSAVRIAVNNLAGVPSIVYGVFGLGFFCYIVGGSIDQTFFAAHLPNPTFGKGGLIWASLTLALLTLPVVIVASEEALSAVPSSMREGSYACGASRWQTIWRIVLPRAAPGIMTGMILAMARGAGEVAPLMLVGAVKLAPALPLDGEFPFLHPQRSFMHLGFHIYDQAFQSQNSEAARPLVFTSTLVLIALVTTLNLGASWLRARLRRRYEGAQF